MLSCLLSRGDQIFPLPWKCRVSTEHFAIKTEISALFPASSSAGGGNSVWSIAGCPQWHFESWNFLTRQRASPSEGSWDAGCHLCCPWNLESIICLLVLQFILPIMARSMLQGRACPPAVCVQYLASPKISQSLLLMFLISQTAWA